MSNPQFYTVMKYLLLSCWPCSGLYITRPPERSCGSNRFAAWALPIQAAILTLYMIYQAVYWNLIWKAPATEFEARQ